MLTPDKVKGSLTSDQYKLYTLIWKRFIASLMASCVLNTVKAEITAVTDGKPGYCLFNATGFSVKFDGYTALYEEGTDEEEEDASKLPELNEGDKLKLKELAGNQHFTQPPSRYTEASLIKALEENGIQIDIALQIDLADEIIEKRMTGRRTCTKCGATYHTKYNPSPNGTRCACGEELIIRSDDDPEVVKSRLVVFHEQTEPLKDFYQEKGLLKLVYGQEILEETTALTMEALA
jgi:adenylate kinase family enzyme